MSIRKFIGIAMFACLVSFGAFAQEKGEDIAKFIAGAYSSKAFTEASVTDRQIELILATGIKAPSARNLQPWHFTVVKDTTLAKKIIPDTKKGNVLIVVSTPEKNQAGSNVDLDCGLAAQNMYLAAQALGLGSHLYTGPIANVNANNKADLQLPAGYKAVIIVKIGNVEKGVDATTAASMRKDKAELVNTK